MFIDVNTTAVEINFFYAQTRVDYAEKTSKNMTVKRINMYECTNTTHGLVTIPYQARRNGARELTWDLCRELHLGGVP